MYHCFFCFTPFHVFNAISIKCNLCANDNADLYLYNNCYFDEEKKIYTNVKNAHIFNNVFTIENRWEKNENLVEIAFRKYFHISVNKQLKRAKKNYKTLIKRDCKYDIVWSYGSAIEMYEIYDIAFLYNKNVKYYGYEEGTGSYIWPCTNALPLSEIQYLNKLLKNKIPDKPEFMFLYLPSCISANVTCKTKTMPKVTKQLLEDEYTKIWGYDRWLNHNIYLLAEGKKDQSFTLKVYEMITQLKNVDVVVKAHPRFLEPFTEKNINILDCGTVPWEIICGHIEDIESKLLIGVFSTSMLTAKSIYDKEPYIIFLNEMISLPNDSKLNENMKEYLQKFTRVYRDTSKLFFPQSFDELMHCIEIWYQREN